MKLETEQGVFHAHFWHHNRGPGKKRRHQYVTELRFHAGPCVLDKENKRCITESVHSIAKCHTKLDVFQRENGRAVALDRALKTRSVTEREMFDRGTRTAVWAAYRAQAPLPKSNGSR